MLEWLRNEVAGWFWVIVACGMLFFAALVSDVVTGAADKLWKRDKN